MASEGPDGIPLLVTCIAGCGFRGDPRNFSLCSACWKVLQTAADHLSDDVACNFAFEKAGFDSLHAAKLAAAFGLKFGGEPPCYRDEDFPAGVKAWRTINRPLTQYDEFPQRGTAACSYIAGFAALWAQCRGAPPSGEDWANCIVLGVRAFHVAREADAAHCMGAVAPITAALHIQHVAAAEANLGFPPEMPVFEETVLLLAAPQELGEEDAVLAAGHCPDFAFGKLGLAAYFRQVLAGELSSVIVVRPPETYCVISSKDDTVALRDSHRRLQLDFESLDAFLGWLDADRSIFASAVACPLELNCVGLYRLAAPRAKAAPVGQALAVDAQPAAPKVEILDSKGLEIVTLGMDARIDSSENSHAALRQAVIPPTVLIGSPAILVGLAPSASEAEESADAAYVLVGESMDVSMCDMEQRRKRACVEVASTPTEKAVGGTLDGQQLADALRRVAKLEQENSRLCAELAHAATATPPNNASSLSPCTAAVADAGSPYPATSTPPVMEDVNMRPAPLDALPPSLPSLPLLRRPTSSGESPVMQAARLGAITKEKQELESDLQFVLAHLPPPAPGKVDGRSMMKVAMPQMLTGSRQSRLLQAPNARGSDSRRSAPPSTTDLLADDMVPSKEVKEQWFTYLDNDGDGRLSQSDVTMGLCRLLQMEANPELVRPIRQLLTACWFDWVSDPEGQAGHVTKEAFLRANSGLADVLIANLRDHLLSTGLMSVPSAKAAKSASSDDSCSIC